MPGPRDVSFSSAFSVVRFCICHRQEKDTFWGGAQWANELGVWGQCEGSAQGKSQNDKRIAGAIQAEVTNQWLLGTQISTVSLCVRPDLPPLVSNGHYYFVQKLKGPAFVSLSGAHSMYLASFGFRLASLLTHPAVKCG